MSWIEKNAEAYAEEVRMRLVKDPIQGVDTIITSNAHKMGYVRGAYDIYDKYVQIVLRLQGKMKWWRTMALIMSGIILIMTIILIILILWK